MSLKLTRWDGETQRSLEALRSALMGEGWTVSEWSDPAGTVYPLHAHEYAEVRVVVSGRLRVGLPDSGDEVILQPGDRLEIPGDLPHWADVDGDEPVIYLAGHHQEHMHRKKQVVRLNA